MSNFKWNKVDGNIYHAKVEEFLAEVWQVGATGKWKFRWAGSLDHQEYETEACAKAACEIRGTSQIVKACDEWKRSFSLSPPK